MEWNSCVELKSNRNKSLEQLNFSYRKLWFWLHNFHVTSKFIQIFKIKKKQICKVTDRFLNLTVIYTSSHLWVNKEKRKFTEKVKPQAIIIKCNAQLIFSNLIKVSRYFQLSRRRKIYTSINIYEISVSNQPKMKYRIDLEEIDWEKCSKRSKQINNQNNSKFWWSFIELDISFCLIFNYITLRNNLSRSQMTIKVK